MKSLDVSQAAAAAQAGGVLSAVLRAEGGSFYIELETRTAGTAVLVTSNKRERRSFRNPLKALEVIRDLGLQSGRFSLEAWRPDEAEFERPSRPDRAAHLKAAHEALSHTEWLQQKVDAARAGLERGTNRSIGEDEWAKIRAAKQAQRERL